MPLSVSVQGKAIVQAAVFSLAAMLITPRVGAQSGLFLVPVTYDAGAPCTNAIAVADLNGDGKADLIVAAGCSHPEEGNMSSSVGILLGNGDGTFKAVVKYDSGGIEASAVGVADINADGYPDVLVANQCADNICASGSVSVLLGNGDGTFRAAVSYSAAQPVSLRVADVNGDGKSDIVLSDNTDSFRVGILLGNGDGTFQPETTYSSGGRGPTAVAVTDVNHDGKADILVANGCDCLPGGEVGVLLGNGDGTFGTSVEYSSGSQVAESIAVGDVNGDGNVDVLALNTCIGAGCGTGGSVGVLLGKGDGTFQPAVTYPSGPTLGFSLAVGDVNGDGRPDAVVTHCVSGCPGTTGGVGILLGNGDGTFQAVVEHSSGGVWPNSVAIADVNRDGQSDLVVANRFGESNGDGTVGVLLHNSKTLHPTSIALSSSRNPSFVAQSVNFTASVTSTSGAIPDGEVVTFFDGASAIATATTSSGTATFGTSSLSVKTHRIRATYSGDAKFKPSTATIHQVVSKYQTATTLISDPNPATVGQSVSMTATVVSQGPNAPTGTIRFMDGTKGIITAQVINGVATITDSKLAAGSHSITAKYVGDASSAPSVSPILTQVIE